MQLDNEDKMIAAAFNKLLGSWKDIATVTEKRENSLPVVPQDSDLCQHTLNLSRRVSMETR